MLNGEIIVDLQCLYSKVWVFVFFLGKEFFFGKVAFSVIFVIDLKWFFGIFFQIWEGGVYLFFIKILVLLSFKYI